MFALICCRFVSVVPAAYSVWPPSASATVPGYINVNDDNVDALQSE